MAEPIQIIITQGGSDGEILNSSLPTKPIEKKDDSSLIKTKSIALASIGMARRVIMNSYNNYVSQTGSYMQQTRINEAINAATMFAGIAIAAVKNPILGVVAIAGTSISLAQQAIAYNINASKQDYQAEKMRQRAGTSLANGSRGTNE